MGDVFQGLVIYQGLEYDQAGRHVGLGREIVGRLVPSALRLEDVCCIVRDV